MDAFTMLVVACIAQEPDCTQLRISDMRFTTLEACEASVDDVIRTVTKQFATRPEVKGREVSYEISCLNRAQLMQKFAIAESDT